MFCYLYDIEFQINTLTLEISPLLIYPSMYTLMCFECHSNALFCLCNAMLLVSNASNTSPAKIAGLVFAQVSWASICPGEQRLRCQVQL